MRFTFGPYVLDADRELLWEGGHLVALAPKTARTLRLLVERQGEVISKQDFMEFVWPDSFVEESNLTQTIFVLRKVLGSLEEGASYIETVPRRGYRFAAPIRALDAAQPEGELPANTRSADVSPLACQRAIAPDLVADRPGIAARNSLRPVRTRSIRLWIASTVGATLLLVLWTHHVRRHTPEVSIHRLTNDGQIKQMPASMSTLVTDGRRIYFTELTANHTVLAGVSTTGGEVSYRPSPFPVAQVVGLHPDGSRLLLGSLWRAEEEQPLVEEDLQSGSVSALTGAGAHDGQWSPDGKRLALVRGGSLSILKSDGTIREIASVKGTVYWPRWSPDSRTLRFSENYEGNQETIWEVDASGKQKPRLLLGDQGDANKVCCGTWTPDGRKYVYLSSAGAVGSTICVRDETNHWWHTTEHSVERLESGPMDQWAAPTPAPNGHTIFAIGVVSHGELVRLDRQTRQPQRFLGGLSGEGVSFSPDGKTVTWSAFPEGTLWRSRLDGSHRMQLTWPPMIARFPQWSPDSTMLVFLGGHAGGDWVLYTMPASGGPIHRLLARDSGEGIATWSPDGSTLAFGHLPQFTHSRSRPLQIDMLHLPDHRVSPVAGSEGLWTARWSPDGLFLSAITRDNSALKLYDLRRGVWSELTRQSVNDVVWSSDSRYLFFDTAFGADPRLYRVRLRDKHVEMWADLQDIRRTGLFAPWLGMAPDGSPLLLRDASTQELYALHLSR